MCTAPRLGLIHDDSVGVILQAACYQFMTPLFGKGVVYDAPLPVRKQQFKFLSGALKAKNLQTYPERIEAETRAFLKVCC